MLQKLLTVVLLILVALPNGSALAENWVNILNNGDSKYYIDGDSFQYDKAKRLVRCWNKIDEGNKSIVSYDFLDLNTRSKAFKTNIVYENGKSVFNDTKSDILLEYIPVVPGTTGEATYKIIEGIAKLEEKNLDWKFNSGVIPEPIAVDSPEWVALDENKTMFLDSSTKKNLGDRIYAWFKVDINSMASLQYQVVDQRTKKTAVLQQIMYSSDNVALAKITFPVLVWFYEESERQEIADILQSIAIIEFMG